MNQEKARKWILKAYLKNKDMCVKYANDLNCITVCNIFPNTEEYTCEHEGIMISPLSEFLWFVNKNPSMIIRIPKYLTDKS